MEATTRCNAAGTLIIGSFSLQNENDLRAGWFALRDAMATQATAPKFTENELNYVKDALEASGFDSATFATEKTPEDLMSSGGLFFVSQTI